MAENKAKNIRQAEILQAAMQLLVKNGFTKTSMDDIAARAGVSKGAVYHHFANKIDLFSALVDFWGDNYLPDLGIPNGDFQSAEFFLRNYFQQIIERFRQNPSVFLAELEFWALSNRNAQIRERTRILFDELRGKFCKIIEKGIEIGEFQKSVDPGITSLAVMTSLQGVIWFHIFEEKNYTVEEYLKKVLDFILAGLKFNNKSLETK